MTLKTTLEYCLSLKRPHKGKSVASLVKYLLATCPNSFVDTFNNVHCKVGDSRTLFSSHTDTVHRTDGANSYMRNEESKVVKGEAATTTTMYRASGDPLGADCGAGVAIMVEMILAGKVGYYVFHAAEEVGGIGSSSLVGSGFVKGQFDRAIAFDRKGTTSVITHQAYGQCCSDEFADALCAALNNTEDMLMYIPDNTGVYTDTAEYVGVVPECTNLSVGYYNEHTNSESLNFTFLEKLSRAVLEIDWEALPIGVIPKVLPKIIPKVTADKASYSGINPLYGNDWEEPFMQKSIEDTEDLIAELTYLVENSPFSDSVSKDDIEYFVLVTDEGDIFDFIDEVNMGLYDLKQAENRILNPEHYYPSKILGNCSLPF